MASGNRKYRGSFQGRAEEINLRHLGWRPRIIQLWNQDGGNSAVWTDSMPNASMIKTVGGTQSFVNTGGITPLADGFRLGGDADLNALNELVHYSAEE